MTESERLRLIQKAAQELGPALVPKPLTRLQRLRLWLFYRWAFR